MISKNISSSRKDRVMLRIAGEVGVDRLRYLLEKAPDLVLQMVAVPPQKSIVQGSVLENK